MCDFKLGLHGKKATKKQAVKKAAKKKSVKVQAKQKELDTYTKAELWFFLNEDVLN